MKVHQSSKTDLLILISVVPVFVLGFNSILFGSRFFNSAHVFIGATLGTLLFGLVTWYCHATVAAILRKNYADAPDGREHLVVSSIVFAVMTVTLFTLICMLYHLTHFLDFRLDIKTYLLSLCLGLIINIVATSLNQSTYSTEKWKDSMLETERLRHEAMQSQLESLKSQVNPHFLFNSLNSLSSLITEDPEQANAYVNEMSRVYRYLLQVNGIELVTVAEELKFIASYFHLLKIRFGDAIEMNFKVVDAALKQLIPPLTLQLLVENAVKHNKVLKTEPLHIEIIATNELELRVKNNLQRKTTKVESSHLGLKNISAKFGLFREKEIVIEDTGVSFSVIVPLMINRNQDERNARHASTIHV
jgi:sensor histidine kinase YesM